MTDHEDEIIPGKWPLWISLALVAILLATYFACPPFQSFVDTGWAVLTSNDEQRVQNWVEPFGWWGPLVIVAAMTVQMFLIIVPTWALMAMSVLAYGPVGGVAICVVAVLVASSVGYAVGRSLHDVTVRKLVGPANRDRLDAVVEKHGMMAVILFRFAPFLSNDAISFIAGAAGMGYFRLLLATFIGITPLSVAIAAVGENWDQLKSGLLWISLVCLIGYGLYVVYERGWYTRFTRS